MARSTLSALIDDLRGMTDAGPADYNVGTAVFWDDNQLAGVLDRNRRDFKRELLEIVPDYISGGSIQYTEYHSRFGNLEATDGGTAVLLVEDGTGANVGAASWSADYRTGVITFTSDQAGTVYYLSGRSYDLNAAAASVWRMKAGNVAKYYDVSTDNHGLTRSQMHRQFLEMAQYYEAQRGVRVVNVTRGDLC